MFTKKEAEIIDLIVDAIIEYNLLENTSKSKIMEAIKYPLRRAFVEEDARPPRQEPKCMVI